MENVSESLSKESFRTIEMEPNDFDQDYFDLNQSKVDFVKNRPVESNEKKKFVFSEKYYQTQKIILMITLTDINLHVKKYRDNCIKTEEDSPFTIRYIRAISPRCFQLINYVNYVEKSDNFVEFFKRNFELVRKLEPLYANSDQDFELFMNFLKFHEMKNYAEFLEIYEKDKSLLLEKESYQNYDKFLRENGESYLNLRINEDNDQQNIGKKLHIVISYDKIIFFYLYLMLNMLNIFLLY